jgi:hypothetical protein
VTRPRIAAERLTRGGARQQEGRCPSMAPTANRFDTPHLNISVQGAWATGQEEDDSSRGRAWRGICREGEWRR